MTFQTEQCTWCTNLYQPKNVDVRLTPGNRLRCRPPPWIVETLPGELFFVKANKRKTHLNQNGTDQKWSQKHLCRCKKQEITSLLVLRILAYQQRLSRSFKRITAVLVEISVFILTKQMHNHQILKCLVHICTQCERTKLCSGIGNNSKTCSASKLTLFTHQQW